MTSQDFPGTEHYREKAAKANDMVESVIERTALEGTAQAWKQTAVSWAHAFDRDIEALCDHIEDQDKEIERLGGTVERYIRKACDEHAKWSGYYYEEKTKNADLRFRISQLEKELYTRTESSEG